MEEEDRPRGVGYSLEQEMEEQLPLCDDIAQIIRSLDTEQNLVFVEPSVSPSQNQLERSDGKSEEEEFISEEEDHFGHDYEEQREKRARSHSSASEERDSRRRRRNESSDEGFLISVSLSPPRPRGVRTLSLPAEAEVSIEDVSDCSEEKEPFDLDLPPHLRTFLSPSSFQRLQEDQLAREEEEQEELNTSLSSHRELSVQHVGPQKSPHSQSQSEPGGVGEIRL